MVLVKICLSTNPVPMTRLKIRKDALKRPAQILDYFAYNVEELPTQLSSGFGYIIVSFSVLSFSDVR